jgi:hypothetical protein
MMPALQLRQNAEFMHHGDDLNLTRMADEDLTIEYRIRLLNNRQIQSFTIRCVKVLKGRAHEI